ncbi:MAG: RidA family protein [Betaproteobacteria bacterium]|nr:RidA family protein [Betaproteobacteria bacterium]
MTDITYHTPMKKLSDATEYNGIVYTAGQVSEDLTLGMKGQTADVLRQIDALLAKCGSHKSRILSATVYVTDMALKPEMDEAWMAWVDQARPPARATVEARLGANVLVEIMITAAQT